MSKSLFIDFMERMLAFPLWIKQTIFLNLTNDLTTYLSNEFLDVKEGELFHIYQPELSEIGENELLTKQKIFKFLEGKDNSIIYNDSSSQRSITFWL